MKHQPEGPFFQPPIVSTVGCGRPRFLFIDPARRTPHVMRGVLDAFVAWCERRGCELDGVELRGSRPTDGFIGGGGGGGTEGGTSCGAGVGAADAVRRGLGVFAARDIEKGARVMSVPVDACVGAGAVRCGAGGAAVPAPFPGATAVECLAWNLLGVKDEEKWKPYVDALPAGFDTPTSGAWDSKEIAELQIGDAVAGVAITLAKDAKAARAVAEKEVDPRAWAWALACARTRATEVRTENASGADTGALGLLLVPFVDMMNHSHEDAHVEFSHEAGPVTGVAADGDDQNTGRLVLTAVRDIPAGTEITTTYRQGDPLDTVPLRDVYALHMGFIGGHDNEDKVDLFKSLRAAATWYAATFKSEAGEEVVDRGKAQGVADALTRRLSGEGPPRLGWGATVTGGLLDLFEYFNAMIMPGKDPSELASHAVALRCQELLLQFPTTAEEDLALLESSQGSARLKLAVEFRLRKKAILQHMVHGKGE